MFVLSQRPGSQMTNLDYMKFHHQGLKLSPSQGVMEDREVELH